MSVISSEGKSHAPARKCLAARPVAILKSEEAPRRGKSSGDAKTTPRQALLQTQDANKRTVYRRTVYQGDRLKLVKNSYWECALSVNRKNITLIFERF